ncbi:MAG: hypothetical protein ACE14V_11615 [bacterium]
MITPPSKVSLSILILISAVLTLSPCFGKQQVYYAPIANNIVSGTPVGDDNYNAYRGWNKEEQQLLFKRTEQARLLIALSIFIDTTDFLAFRTTPDHDLLKAKLNALLDNVHAWPEYIYVARLVGSETTYTYQVLCSSSDIIEGETLQPIEINPNMQLALQRKQPIVTDMFSPFGSGAATHAAVYYPIYYEEKPIGILVFVKGYWTTRTLTPEDRITNLEKKVRELEQKIQQLQLKSPNSLPPCEFNGAISE